MTKLLGMTVQRARRFQRRVLRRLGHTYATVGVNGYRMTLDLNDTTISDWLFMRRTWEPYETRLLRNVFRPGSTFVDIGAHIGYYSLLAARVVGPRGRVVAFEPAPANYALLVRNVLQNRLGRAVHTENCAMAEQATELTLFLSAVNNGDHRVYPSSTDDDKIFNGGRPRAQLRVPAVSLDEYLDQHALGPIDVIKMDVQGAELSVLRGMQATLHQNPGVILFMEYWPFGLQQAGGNPAHLLQFLTEQAGMSLLYIQPEIRQVTPIAVEDLAAREFDPTLQVDLICSRNPTPWLATLTA